MNHLISARRPDLVIVNKKREPAEFWTLPSQLITCKNWKKLKGKISTETVLENWKNFGTWKWRWYLLYWCVWYSNQRIGTGTRELGNKRISGDHPIGIIIKIGQNTEKSSGDLRRLAVAQTLLEDYHLTLVWKTL